MAAKSEEAIAKARARAKAWRQANPEWETAYRDANSERSKEVRRARYAADRDKIAAERKAKRDADPEAAREADRRMRARKRVREIQRLKHNEHNRLMRERDPEAARARSRRFREEHPDKVREYQRRYRQRHPERAKENQAAAAQRHRDANAEAIRERQRLLAAAHRRDHPDAYRQWYQRNLEAQRERGRQASRLRNRLKKAGLPPRTIRRVYADERRANDTAADEYFARPRSVEELAVIATELDLRSALQLPKAVRTLRRQLLDGPLTAAEYLQRSADRHGPDSEGGTFRSQRYLEALHRMKKRELTALRMRHEQRLQNIRDQRPQIYEQHYLRRRAELRDEIRMDSAARGTQGLAPYDLDVEMRKRVNDEVDPIMNAKLADAKEQTLHRVDEILARYRTVVDPAAPYRGPAPDSGGLGLR